MTTLTWFLPPHLQTKGEGAAFSSHALLSGMRTRPPPYVEERSPEKMVAW